MGKLDTALRDAFARHAAKRVVDEIGPLTFAELDRLAATCARAFVEGGIRPGDRIAVVASNTRWGAAAYLGAWKAGAVLVPVNPAFTVPEIAYILGHSRPRAVFADAGRLDDVRQASASAGEPVSLWMSDTPVAGSTGPALSELPATAEIWPEIEWPEVVCVLYTSGTTGRPRGAMITQDNLLFAQGVWRGALQMSERDVVLCALPIFHSYALILLFFAGLITGHDIILEKGFRFPRVLRLIAEHRITVFPAIPPVHEAIAMLRWDPAECDVSSLRLAISGAAPLAPATRARARERLGNPPFVDGYGITETSTILSIGPVGAKIPEGASGRPLPGVEIRIVDDEGQALGPECDGEIWVKCGGVMKGYYDDPEASAAVMRGEWYRTGDVGRLDADGFLYISDRLKDVIIVSGENVSPREIEAAILEFPGVARAAVVKMPVPDTGEAPLAYIVPEAGAAIRTGELVAFLRQRLTTFKIPRKFQIVEDLPTSPSGKVLKRELGS